MLGRSGNSREVGWLQRNKGEEEKREQRLEKQPAFAQVRPEWAGEGPRTSSHL